MSESYSASYAAAGVDITAGYRAVELMKSHVARTMTAGVCGDIGGFGGLYQPELSGMSQPVLVSGSGSRTLWAAWPRAASRRAAPSSAVRPPSTPA